MNFNIPKELNSEFKLNQYLSLLDIVILIGGFVVAWLLSNYVYDNIILRGLWYVFFESSLLYLTRKSTDNPGLRNYKSIYLMFTRNVCVYRRI